MTFVVLEYPEPTSPGNRRVWDFGAGPCTFEATRDEAADFQRRLGADSPFRVVPVDYAAAHKLMPQ